MWCLVRSRWPVVLSALLVALTLPASAQTQPAKGRKHALVVGVRDYDASTLSALRYTENDAEELAGVLRQQGGFTVRVLTTSRGAKRKELAPTSSNIRDTLRSLLRGKTRHDTVLIALAGHGIQGKVREGSNTDESFFCPTDAQLNDTRTLIALGQLFRELRACGAGVKLLLVDACRNDPTLGRNVDLDSLPPAPRGSAVLFSCRPGQRAFETDRLGKGHGVFFHFVLEGLRGKARNSDNEVTWAHLAEYVTRQVSRTVPALIGGGARQTPHLLANLEGESPVLVVPARTHVVRNLAREAEAFARQGQEALTRKEWRRMHEAFQKAVQLAPNNAYYWDRVGHACWELRDYEGCVNAHRKAVSLAPQLGGHRSNLAGALWQVGRAQEARKEAEAALRLGTHNHWVFAKLGLRPPQ
jgi:hypothetical protein